MVRQKSTARESLREFELIFAEIVSVALRRFVEEQAQLRHKYTARTEANIIHDYMRLEARKRLGDHPRIRFIDKGNRFEILVGSEWRIKLKKLDRQLRTRNIETQAVFAFLNQMAGQGFLFDPSVLPTNLHLGYKRDGVEITPSNVYLACPNGRKVAWD